MKQKPQISEQIHQIESGNDIQQQNIEGKQKRDEKIWGKL